MAKQQDANTVSSLIALRTTPEAAAYLKLKPSTMDQLRWTGRGPRFVRIGGRSIRYRQSDLDAYIDAQVFSSTTEADASLLRH